MHITSRRKFDNKSNICYIQGNAHDLEFISNLLDSCKYDCIVDFMAYSTLEFVDRVHSWQSTLFIVIARFGVSQNHSNPNKNKLSQSNPLILLFIAIQIFYAKIQRFIFSKRIPNAHFTQR